MAKTKSISVPVELLKLTAKGELPPDAVVFFVASAAFPDKSSKQIAKAFQVSDEGIEAASDYLEDYPEEEKPKRRSGGRNAGRGRQSSNDQYDYPRDFGKDIRDRLKEAWEEATGDEPYVFSHEQAEKIWAAIGEDEDPMEMLDMAIACAVDFHENKDAIKSPAGFITRQLEHDSREDLETKVQQIEEEGTAIQDSRKVKQRARQRATEQLNKRSKPKQDPAWKSRRKQAEDDEEPEDEDDGDEEFDEEEE